STAAAATSALTLGNFRLAILGIGLLGLAPPFRRRWSIGLVHRIQGSGGNLTFGTALQIIVEVLPILLHGGDATEVRHALLRAAVGNSGVKIILGECLEGIHERRTHQSFLLRTVTAVARHGTPRLPPFQRLVVDLVPIL